MLEIAFCVGVPSALMLAGHYMPWRSWIGRDLHRSEAYAWGMVGTLAPATIAALSAGTNTTATVVLFWLAALSAGATTLVAKGIDNDREHRHQLRDYEDRIRVTNAHNHDTK